MTRPALLRESDARRLAKVALEKAVELIRRGRGIEVDLATGKIRFFTAIHTGSASVPVDSPESFESLDDYKAWRDGKDARRD